MMVVFGGGGKMCVISKNEAKFCHRSTAILAPGSWIFLFLTIYYLLGWSVNKGKLFQNNQMENHKLSETWELSEQVPHAAKWRCQKLIEIPQTTKVASVCYRWVEKSKSCYPSNFQKAAPALCVGEISTSLHQARLSGHLKFIKSNHLKL